MNVYSHISRIESHRLLSFLENCNIVEATPTLLSTHTFTYKSIVKRGNKHAMTLIFGV